MKSSLLSLREVLKPHFRQSLHKLTNRRHLNRRFFFNRRLTIKMRMTTRGEVRRLSHIGLCEIENVSSLTSQTCDQERLASCETELHFVAPRVWPFLITDKVPNIRYSLLKFTRCIITITLPTQPVR